MPALTFLLHFGLGVSRVGRLSNDEATQRLASVCEHGTKASAATLALGFVSLDCRRRLSRDGRWLSQGHWLAPRSVAVPRLSNAHACHREIEQCPLYDSVWAGCHAAPHRSTSSF